MKLHYSKISPFVRKVRVVALEKGIELELVETNPHNSPAGLLANNPLSKVPVLELDNGEAIFDSPVICEFIDALDEAKPMIPREGAGRFKVLTVAALADGMMDAAVSAVMERRRPEDKRYEAHIDRQLAAIRRGFDALEEEVEFLAGGLNLASIAVGVAIGYIDFRLPELGWAPSHPKLSKWYEGFARRSAMAETAPREG